jgi:hypothetical protein
MRVVTFYSYKGGVGRTLALLNVAALLLRRGHRVLLVDFDLEAPGLDAVGGLTYQQDHLRQARLLDGSIPLEPSQTQSPVRRGLVDLIGDYLAEQRVPDVRDYVSEAWFLLRPTGSEAPDSLSPRARLFVLGAGDRSSEEAYRSRLAAIDFKRLYRERDGYLLFDDIRTQWAKALECDYVLIDSRTGHTDIGAICTRQLPDHVFAVMFPNEQNLVGIAAELRAVRETHSAECDLAVSRIPRLDDFEGEFLEFEKSVRKRTGLRNIYRVHAYDSLTLLRDHVYCADERLDRTWLSREMRRIAEAIEVRNTAEPTAVLRSLRPGRNRVEAVVGKARVLDWLHAVESIHRDNVHVLDALRSFTQSHLKAGFDSAAVEKRIVLLTEAGDRAVAANQALACADSDPAEAIRLASWVLGASGPLSSSLEFECFAMLCRLAPALAERVGDIDPPLSDWVRHVGSDRIVELFRCRRGLQLLGRYWKRAGILATLQDHWIAGLGGPPRESFPLYGELRSRIALLPLFALDGTLRGVLSRQEMTTVYNSARQETTDRFPVCPYRSREEFAVWLWLYSEGHIVSPPRVSEYLVSFEGDEEVPPSLEVRSDLSVWESSGVRDTSSLEEKACVALANLLFGRLAPIDVFVNEAAEMSPDEPVWNPWRLLLGRLGDLVKDLEDIRSDRARCLDRLEGGAPLALLTPPFFSLRPQPNA